MSNFPNIEFLPDFKRLDPSHPKLMNIGLLCVDLENIVVPYGGSKPDSVYRDQIAELIDSGINVVGISNTTDSNRAHEIGDMLGMEGVINKGLPKDPERPGTFRSKSFPDMFVHAVEVFEYGKNGSKAAMVDDQLKNVQGCSQVDEFSTYFWTFPNYFSSQHRGVLLGRAVEVPVGFGFIAAQKAVKAIQFIPKLKNGQYGEW